MSAISVGLVNNNISLQI